MFSLIDSYILIRILKTFHSLLRRVKLSYFIEQSPVCRRVLSQLLNSITGFMNILPPSRVLKRLVITWIHIHPSTSYKLPQKQVILNSFLLQKYMINHFNRGYSISTLLRSTFPTIPVLHNCLPQKYMLLYSCPGYFELIILKIHGP